MKKVKIILWIIVAAFVFLVFFQNQDIFLTKQRINLNLYLAGEYPSELPFIVWLLITLIIGLLIAYFFGLSEKFKLKKTIKALKAKIDTQIETISQIRSELESRTAFSYHETPAAPDDIEPNATESIDVKAPSDD